MSKTSDRPDGSDSEGEAFAMFEEPPSFRPPSPEPTFVDASLPSGHSVPLRLVGHSPLWGHHLWNAGRILSSYLGDNADRLVRSKDVFEFGAGAGLPGITAWAEGASRVVLTDYPDADLVANLQTNVASVKRSLQPRERDGGKEVAAKMGSIDATGYLWGAPLPELMQGQCDTLIMGDLLFNHSEHDKLVESVKMCLRRKRESVALVFFTPYRPWLLDNDLDFFKKVEATGLFTVEKVLETTMDKVMFEKDRGDELLRRTVYGYELRWKHAET